MRVEDYFASRVHRRDRCGAGKLLGHTKTSTTEKYSHLSADPVRAVNEALGNQIAAILHEKK